ncbi:3'-5' exonuclease [Oceanobacter antarcticus]|uniref:DNA 3'-5' helicase n=1 Tax=Oceanobacter antarcticus TaxID=3133425 RepID=A0ABW8NF34_9GAMM|tara:strand:+ start:6573 stop:8663 length:2091 start_codon:yes stop_codon:yes gene_type:complete
MEFRTSDTFASSLGKLTNQEQKAVKQAAFDLHMYMNTLDSAPTGLRLHKIDKSKDPNFWSASANMDLRIVLHRTEGSILLCYVDHHDKAYRWAEKRKLETHPTTGAAQLVEVREIQREEQTEPEPFQYPKAADPIFIGQNETTLLGYGVPQDWISAVLSVSTEDELVDLIDVLPSEASEALLEIHEGKTPKPAKKAAANSNPFNHPDAMRRFRVLEDIEALQRALDYPWDKWTLFLHPSQQDLVERDFKGPARVTGSAGTGKTIVALHRAMHLVCESDEKRVLLATYSGLLANRLRGLTGRLISENRQLSLGERLEVYSVKEKAAQLYKANLGQFQLATEGRVAELLASAAKAEGSDYPPRFLLDEWNYLIDASQLRDWESYRDAKRTGRKSRLSEAKRQHLWAIFNRVWQGLEQQSLITEATMYTRLAETLAQRDRVIFDHVLIDEAQDLTIAQLKLIAALGQNRPNSLFFAGDLGQRIFQPGFSWKALGIDLRGRSSTLKINYRTSHQIRRQADKLLDSEMSDSDGNTDDRSGTISLFNGPDPVIELFDEQDEENAFVGEKIRSWLDANIAPEEIGIMVRSEAQYERAKAALGAAGADFNAMSRAMEWVTGKVSLCTMHLAKGLEFKCVVLMACDDDVLPLEERLEAVMNDTQAMKEVEDTERHLLYVACTRARDELVITSAGMASDYLDDLVE